MKLNKIKVCAEELVFPRRDRRRSALCGRGRLLPFRRGRQAAASLDRGGGPDTIDWVSWRSWTARSRRLELREGVRSRAAAAVRLFLVGDGKQAAEGDKTPTKRRETLGSHTGMGSGYVLERNGS